MRQLHAVAGLALLLVAVAVPAASQETRAESIAAAQAEKATRLRQDTPGWLERTVVAVRRAAVESPSGAYPVIDSVYGGGGVTAGLAYRQYTGNRTRLDVRGLYSVKHYRALEGVFLSPGHAGGWLDVEGAASWMDAPQVGFYGRGTRSTPDDRANFQLRQTLASARLILRPARLAVVGGGLGLEAFDLDQGKGRAPSIETRYTPVEAPGLGQSPTFVRATATAGLDWRPSSGYTRSGGLYELRYHRYAGTGAAAGFDRLDAEIVQHLPILRETWVLSGRARLQSTLGDDDPVPFFLLPSLGGGTTLRGYGNWRFRDRHAFLAQGEFRWIPNRLGLDMALFVDAGTVAATAGRLRREPFVRDVGLGFRLHTPKATPIRIELARGREGLHLVLASKAVF